jgi:nucleotide-binding universal stress UspA family protein
VINPIPAVMPTAAGQMPLRIDAYRDTVFEDAQEKLEELSDRRVPAAMHIRREVRWGNAAETIVEVANEAGCDLIVIGTRGATGLSRLVMGSVTAKVVRMSDVPVLAVPAEDDE